MHVRRGKDSETFSQVIHGVADITPQAGTVNIEAPQRRGCIYGRTRISSYGEDKGRCA